MNEGLRNADSAQLPAAEAHGKEMLDKLVALGVVASKEPPYKLSGAGTSLVITGTPDGASAPKEYRGRVRNVIASLGFLRQGAITVETEQDGIKYFNFAKIASIEKAQ